MSSSSKSKSKDKKTGKDAAKTSSKSSTHVNTGAGGVPSNGYNPLLGTFHTVDTTPFSNPRVQVNGRYQTIEETDDHSINSFGTGVECDSISNNGSWSGESEDQNNKDKSSQQSSRQDSAAVVVPGADNDKREKIRQKNEKKHQRQKERRAQELHERCCSYLTSRKLKALAQQLVSMGFTQERATMALILNEGRVEESVAWLFEGGEEEESDNKTNDQIIGNKKIDISEELARIAEMEIRCKCSRQEVERAVVALEGDLEKAEESLRAYREDPPSSVPPKQDRTEDPKLQVASNLSLMRMQQKAAPTAIIHHHLRNERDLNYPKLAGHSVVDPGNRVQPKMEWAKPQHISAPPEKRWPVAAASAQPTKPELGYELKNQLPARPHREPSIAGKMGSSTNVGQSNAGNMSAIGSSSAMGWSANNNVEIMKPNGYIPVVSETRASNSGTVGRNQFYNQFPSYHQPSHPFISNGVTLESVGTSHRVNMNGNTNGSLTRNSASPTIAAASSLGLFSGFGVSSGVTGSSSSLDWDSGSLVVDYTNIDWSLERGRGGGDGSSSMPRRPSSGGGGGFWPGMMNVGSNMQYDTRTYDTYNMAGLQQQLQQQPLSMMRNVAGRSFPVGLMKDGGVGGGGGGGSEMSTGSCGEWGSPFEERDLFSLQRNFVSSSPSVEHLGEYLKKEY